jgi:hypothetical protein
LFTWERKGGLESNLLRLQMKTTFWFEELEWSDDATLNANWNRSEVFPLCSVQYSFIWFIYKKKKKNKNSNCSEREREYIYYEEGGPERRRRSRLELFWNCWNGFELLLLLLPLQKKSSSTISFTHLNKRFCLSSSILLVILVLKFVF